MRYSGYITDVAGIRVGHYTDNIGQTGCTAVLCVQGGVCGVDVRGGAPGTRETDVAHCGNLVEKAHAVILSGGSAYGLAAADGVMRYLEERGYGFATPEGVVPIVMGAVIYDLAVGSAKVRPTADNGYAAADTASNTVNKSGAIGAGTGATVGKAAGMAHAMAGGIGSASLTLADGTVVAALAVVNAFGDIYDEHGQIIAGAKVSGQFINTLNSMLGSQYTPTLGNTTLAVVATDARLTKEQANRVATCGHDGMAIAIRPVHTLLDGDTVFALSCGEKPADINCICAAAAEAVRRAICNAVAID